jgi:hypothetical protein
MVIRAYQPRAWLQRIATRIQLSNELVTMSEGTLIFDESRMVKLASIDQYMDTPIL